MKEEVKVFWGYDYIRRFKDHLTIEELEEKDMEERFEEIKDSIAVVGCEIAKRMPVITEMMIEMMQPFIEAVAEAARATAERLREIGDLILESAREREEINKKIYMEKQSFERPRNQKVRHQYIKPVARNARSHLRR